MIYLCWSLSLSLSESGVGWVVRCSTLRDTEIMLLLNNGKNGYSKAWSQFTRVGSTSSSATSLKVKNCRWPVALSDTVFVSESSPEEHLHKRSTSGWQNAVPLTAWWIQQGYIFCDSKWLSTVLLHTCPAEGELPLRNEWAFISLGAGLFPWHWLSE